MNAIHYNLAGQPSWSLLPPEQATPLAIRARLRREAQELIEIHGPDSQRALEAVQTLIQFEDENADLLMLEEMLP